MFVHALGGASQVPSKHCWVREKAMIGQVFTWVFMISLVAFPILFSSPAESEITASQM